MRSDAHIKGLETPIVQEPPQPTEEELLDIRIGKIADAIYGAEGRCDKLHGGSGEYGCYQYLPSTWRAYSVLITGKVLTQTKENERYITEEMIRKWLAEGISERGIFLIWNQGNPGPDCYRGVNKHGVRYDSCDYADRAIAFLAEQPSPQSP